MIYVMSDIHGCYDKYKEMLRKIRFSENDILYVLGDVIDRGTDGIRILFDMMIRPNVIPIIGNHELTAYAILKRLSVEITEDNYENYLDEQMIQMYQEWMINGGSSTSKEYSSLTCDQKESVLEYLEEFSLFEEIEVGKNKFVLVHAGIDNFNENKILDDYEVGDFVFSKCDYSKTYYKDKYLITGHTPTFHIDDESKGKIFQKNNHIAIDCGAVFGQNLGCMCLNTFEKFYV